MYITLTGKKLQTKRAQAPPRQRATTERMPRCEHCSRDCSTARRCSKCALFYFCDNTCFTNDWKTKHKGTLLWCGRTPLLLSLLWCGSRDPLTRDYLCLPTQRFVVSPRRP